MHILPRHFYENGTLLRQFFPGPYGKFLEDSLAEKTIDPLTEKQIIRVIRTQSRGEDYPAVIRSYGAEYILYLLWDRFAKLCFDEGAAVNNDNFNIALPKKTLVNGQEVGDVIICSYHCCNGEAFPYSKFWIGPLQYASAHDYIKNVPCLMYFNTTDSLNFSSDTLKRVVSHDSEGLVYFYMHMDEYVKNVKQVLCRFNTVCKKMNKAIIEQTGSAYEC